MGNKMEAMAGLAKSAGLNQGGQFRIWGANLEATTVFDAEKLIQSLHQLFL